MNTVDLPRRRCLVEPLVWRGSPSRGL